MIIASTSTNAAMSAYTSAVEAKSAAAAQKSVVQDEQARAQNEDSEFPLVVGLPEIGGVAFVA